VHAFLERPDLEVLAGDPAVGEREVRMPRAPDGSLLRVDEEPRARIGPLRHHEVEAARLHHDTEAPCAGTVMSAGGGELWERDSRTTTVVTAAATTTAPMELQNHHFDARLSP